MCALRPLNQISKSQQLFINLIRLPVRQQNPYEDSSSHLRRSTMDSKYAFASDTSPPLGGQESNYMGQTRAAPPGQPLYGTAPDLPPRIDRTSKPNGVTPPSTLLPTPSSRHQTGMTNGSGGSTYGRTAHERLFSNSKPSENPTYEDEYSTRPTLLGTPEKRSSAGNSLDRNQNSLNDKQQRTPSSAGNGKTNGSYDSVSSYDSCNNAMQSLRLGPNAPDDLKSVPNLK